MIGCVGNSRFCRRVPVGFHGRAGINREPVRGETPKEIMIAIEFPIGMTEMRSKKNMRRKHTETITIGGVTRRGREK